jgi:hypothetical protein
VCTPSLPLPSGSGKTTQAAKRSRGTYSFLAFLNPEHLTGENIAIKRVKAGYRLVSKKGKNLGTYKSKAGAEKREGQVQYFKRARAK